MDTDLIPGLPDDVGLECLVRVPYQSLTSMTSVCRTWKKQINLPEFWRRRKASGSTRKLIVMSQARLSPTRKPGLKKYESPPVYRLTVLESDTGHWAELPSIPTRPNGPPIFSQLVAVGSELVVVGGCDPPTWEVSRDVHVYDFVTATWSRGAPMPGPSRRFFACGASDAAGGTVYVAGGHDDEKCALRSAIAYDVRSDAWAPLPDMSRGRDEAKGIFVDGRFYVVGGYETDTQGGFGADAEWFDPEARKWVPAHENFMGRAQCPRNLCAASDEGGSVFMLREGGHDVAMLRGGEQRQQPHEWADVARLPPSGVRHVAHVSACWGKLMVIGCERFGEGYKVFVLDLKGCNDNNNKWEIVGERCDEGFSGHVQSGCCLEL